MQCDLVFVHIHASCHSFSTMRPGCSFLEGMFGWRATTRQPPTIPDTMVQFLSEAQTGEARVHVVQRCEQRFRSDCCKERYA